nr:E3 UFM1-protein ligase 1 homolog [Tanacetum cinerariifolium]
EINDRLQECSQIALAEIAVQLQVGSELLVNVLEPRVGSLLKGVELTEFSPTGIGVHRHEYDFEDQLWKYEKYKESLVRNRKECDGKQKGSKEDDEWVLDVHLFGKGHDLRLIRNQEWVNEGGDIDIHIRDLNVNGFLAYIRDGDDLLNQQKKREDVVELACWNGLR